MKGGRADFVGDTSITNKRLHGEGTARVDARWAGGINGT